MIRDSLRFPPAMVLGVAMALGGGSASLLAAETPPLVLAGPQMDQLTVNTAGAYPATAPQSGRTANKLSAAGVAAGSGDAPSANERPASGLASGPASGVVPTLPSGGSTAAKSDSGTVTSGTVSRSVTSSGPGATGTSSATASGSGTSSVFVASMVGTQPTSQLMPSQLVPSMASLAAAPGFTGR